MNYQDRFRKRMIGIVRFNVIIAGILFGLLIYWALIGIASIFTYVLGIGYGLMVLVFAWWWNKQ